MIFEPSRGGTPDARSAIVLHSCLDSRQSGRAGRVSHHVRIYRWQASSEEVALSWYLGLGIELLNLYTYHV